MRGFRRDLQRKLCDAHPADAAAEAWLHADRTEESTWAADTLLTKMRYFAELANAIITAEFLFEPNALPS